MTSSHLARIWGNLLTLVVVGNFDDDLMVNLLYIEKSTSLSFLADMNKFGNQHLSMQYLCQNPSSPFQINEENIEHVKSLCKTQNMLLLGDLNTDFETINGGKLLDLCTQHNLHYCINEPTRITETSKTCLDQILINTPNFISEWTVEPPVCNNNHCSVGIKLNFIIPL